MEERDVAINTKYKPQQREGYWQDFWGKSQIFKFNPEAKGEPYAIDTPPPTVSGKLHLGHIYSYSHAEVLTRHKRMRGLNVRYPIGSDDNGLPTERLTEKDRGIRASDVKPGEFVEMCRETRTQYWQQYTDLWKSVGLSVDWDLCYSTISPEVQALAQQTFKKLLAEGRIYKKDAPALYCCECATAVAQAEVEDKSEKTDFYDLAFKLPNGETLPIATTRPEYLAACVAVFVNPEDSRYANIVGQEAMTPLGEKVPILTDDKVDMEKGTGAVMCCTFGDETDLYWARRYDLPIKVILGKDGRFFGTESAPEIDGLRVRRARAAMVERLRKEGAILGEEQIVHAVGVHERCGTAMEILPREQWFVRMLDMKEAMLEAGSRIRWYPAHMEKRFQEWVRGLKWDWAVSRERYAGIPVPVYECDSCGHLYVPQISDDQPVDPRDDGSESPCPECDSGKLVPDMQVLDTWFTSSLTPVINNINPKNGSMAGKLYPASMRPHAHDIIRTWTTYTILMSQLLGADVPFKDLMISGHILLRKGEKISKKSGGGKIQPADVIKEHSADAVRYAMCGASLGADAYFEEAELGKGKKLANKIFNAGKFTLGSIIDFDPKSFDPARLEATDKWILEASEEAARKMSGYFDNYEVSKARIAFEEFFWKQFCDNYIELVKDRLKDPAQENETCCASAKYALYHSYLNILKMATPFVPHITEEMYHAQFVPDDGQGLKGSIVSGSSIGLYCLAEETPSVSQTDWPGMGGSAADADLQASARFMLEVVGEIRKYRSSNNMAFATPMPALHIYAERAQLEQFRPFLADVQNLSKAQRIELHETGDEAQGFLVTCDVG